MGHRFVRWKQPYGNRGKAEESHKPFNAGALNIRLPTCICIYIVALIEGSNKYNCNVKMHQYVSNKGLDKNYE